jgi:hypothetical protein
MVVLSNGRYSTRALIHLNGSGVIRGVTGDLVQQRMALGTKMLPSH